MGINLWGISGIGLGIGAILIGVVAYKIAQPERKEAVKKMTVPAIIFSILAIIFGCLSSFL